MHTRLVSYLRDNRDQIIESWLTEVEIPAPTESRAEPCAQSRAQAPTQACDMEVGVVPYAFLDSAFDGVLEIIEHGPAARKHSEILHLNDFLGITCECRERCFGGRVCMELHDSGLQSFMSVFDEDWDTEHEFSIMDRECCKDLINHALSGFFSREVDLCHHKSFRSDCPFVAHG